MGRGRFRIGPAGGTGTDPRILLSDTAEVGQTLVPSVVDAPGQVVAYNWDLGNGTQASGRVTTAVYEDPGTYDVSVTLRDGGGQLITTLDTTVNVSAEAPDDDEEETSEDVRAPRAEPEAFDQTYRLTSSEVPFAVGERPAIPFPWQGIPRTAVVYNLNFVYDDEDDEWVRDTGNGSGGLNTIAEGTDTVASNADFAKTLGINQLDLGGDVLLPAGSFTDTSKETAEVSWTQGGTAGTAARLRIVWSSGDQDYRFQIANSEENAVTVKWKVFRV